MAPDAGSRRMTIRRILVANRGEIAVRVIRACRELGIESVSVYSDADARARHVVEADRAIRIGPAAPGESYLSIDAVLDAAGQAGADAIHPGYGFLSEEPRFAAACVQRGLIFIGPPADVIAKLGSKIAARDLARSIGVPVVPGETPADQSDASIATAARRVGLPVLVKPSAGGGGIGMKTVREDADVPEAIAQARREALAAFGDGTLYIERLIEHPRHVEFQILADHHGTVIHLFERECSLQRRHQKVIEESPSTALTPGLRVRMGDAAVAIARAAGYRNAGTVEFLLDAAGGRSARGSGSSDDGVPFYFLEVNTRLQVEHPVTEAVTGVDLVRAQIAIAAGDPIRWRQDQITQRGHAIEARIYAEDPAHGYLPQAGRLLLYREPAMPGIRIDAGVVEGDDVPVHYDPLLAKLIASGEDRESARRRAIEALKAYPILGIRTNVAFLIALLEHQRFVDGRLDVDFIEAEGAGLRDGLDQPPSRIAMELAAAARDEDDRDTGRVAGAADPWATLRGFRG